MKDKYDLATPEFPDMEGDFIYTRKRSGVCLATPKEAEVFEEAHLHHTVRAFEELLHKHGVQFMLDQMSLKSVRMFGDYWMD